MSKRQWLLFDGRACGGSGTHDAFVMDTADSEREAKEAARDHGQCAVYSYEDTGTELIDEKWEFDTDANGRAMKGAG